MLDRTSLDPRDLPEAAQVAYDLFCQEFGEPHQTGGYSLVWWVDPLHIYTTETLDISRHGDVWVPYVERAEGKWWVDRWQASKNLDLNEVVQKTREYWLREYGKTPPLP